MNYIQIYKLLEKKYPHTKTALEYSNTLELLIATILSAQCTDKTVNNVTKILFTKYKSLKDYLNVKIADFEQDIKQTGFYHNKAKNIISALKIIDTKYNGKVPDSMDELITLPGVARKTANVVLTYAFNKIEGIVVDTHVRRLSFRIGLTKNSAPEKIEQDLMHLFSKDKWQKISELLIAHGRNICFAGNPKCNECLITNYCPKYGINK